MRCILVLRRSEVSRTGLFGGEEGLEPSKNEAMCDIPCSRKILREFYIADWPFLGGVCGNKFLRFEMTENSAGS